MSRAGQGLEAASAAVVEAPHCHVWYPAGLVRKREYAYSPVSPLDHQHRIIVRMIRTCACGAVRRTVVDRGEWMWTNR